MNAPLLIHGRPLAPGEDIAVALAQDKRNTDIDNSAALATAEIHRMAEHARRSVGQRIRYVHAAMMGRLHNNV